MSNAEASAISRENLMALTESPDDLSTDQLRFRLPALALFYLSNIDSRLPRRLDLSTDEVEEVGAAARSALTELYRREERRPVPRGLLGPRDNPSADASFRTSDVEEYIACRVPRSLWHGPNASGEYAILGLGDAEGRVEEVLVAELKQS
jgi:hypothetical protein